MDKVLSLISVNGETNVCELTVFDQESIFPYQICDIQLPVCRTGFVYYLISCRDTSFMYIGTTKCICQRLNQNHCGHGSESTSPLELGLYAVFAYICGFDGNQQLQYHVEREWKMKRDRLVMQGIRCQQRFALSGQDVVEEVNNDARVFGNNHDLHLVLLFCNIIS